jgi:hypothetical protein
MTSTLRATMKALAKADARRIREVESITVQKVKPTAAGAKAGKEAGARVRATAKGGKVADTLRAGLRELAQSDARTMRGMAGIVRDATPKVAGGKGGKALKGAKKALPAAKAEPVASSSGTINRTRADAATAYKKRIRPARAAAARMAPADKPVSVSRSDGNLIVGKTWEQIQAAQRGAKRALDGRPITGKPQKPKATQGDRRLLAQKGMKGLKAEGMYGVLDRLKTSKVRIGGKAKSSIGIRKPPSVTPTPKPPTRAKGSRATLPRTPGTVAKPKGLKPGALAVRREEAASRNKNARPQKVNQESVRSLLAANRAVAVYPRKGIVVIDGFRRQKVSKTMAAALHKIVKDHWSSR